MQLLETIAVVWRKLFLTWWVTWERWRWKFSRFSLGYCPALKFDPWWQNLMIKKIKKIKMTQFTVIIDQSLRKPMNWELFHPSWRSSRIETNQQVRWRKLKPHIGLLMLGYALCRDLLFFSCPLCSSFTFPSSVWRREIAVLAWFALVLPQTVIFPCNGSKTTS